MSDLLLQEETRRLTALTLPRVEALLCLMRSENVADPVEAFRLLLRLDPVHPPPLDVAKYLPLVVALRTIFVYGGNETAVEVALGRAADLTGGLL